MYLQLGLPHTLCGEYVMDRRNFVRGVGVLTVAGSLAGCSGNDSNSDSDGEETDKDTTTSGSSANMVAAPSDVKDYLSDDGTFSGKMADMTGEDSVNVKCGAEGNAGNNAFDPSAIQVDAGTTVTWSWTGNGSHNVVDEDGAFESELKTSGTFEHTFEEAGTTLYYCNPHKALGMKGAVVVK